MILSSEINKLPLVAVLPVTSDRVSEERKIFKSGPFLALKFSARTMKRDSPTFSRLQLPLMDFFSISAPLLMTSAPERQIDCEGVS